MTRPLDAFDTNRLGDVAPAFARSPNLAAYVRQRAEMTGAGDEIEVLAQRSAALDTLLTPPTLRPFQQAAIARMEAAAHTADSEVDDAGDLSEVDEVDVRRLDLRDIAELCGLADEYDAVVSGKRGPAASYRMRVYHEFEPDWKA